MKKWVYFFGEGNKDMKDLLGGKGANLNEMTNLGIPIPSGFTITTETCNEFYKLDKTFPKELEDEIRKNLEELEKKTGKTFGAEKTPLLLSVRSGARISMPGMMDTVLNLGLNEKSLKALAKKDERFAYDSFRRFIQMFGNVVMGIKAELFEDLLDKAKEKKGVKLDVELEAKDLKEVVRLYKELFEKETNNKFPEDPFDQLILSIKAVFGSWNTPRAVTYRNIHNIAHDLGTAVNVQAMVFGNLGDDSATGVAFTRNPSNGEDKFYGEYLVNAQGEDVVAGVRTPKPIVELGKEMPELYKQLYDIAKKLENHFKDMQDLEFTIEEKKLFLLQTRTGKRTAQAAVKIAIDMANEGLITKEEALLRVEPNSLDQLLHSTIDSDSEQQIVAKGLAASPGAAVGKVVFNPDKAEELGKVGEDVVLVRMETSPEDIHGMVHSKGILTARGGMTSHAAVVARGMGICCVAGCEDIKINEKEGFFVVGENKIKEDDIISLNGNTGEVILGEAKLIEPQIGEEFEIMLSWADNARKLGVRANADIPHDAEVALKFGAEGIGLCRTEHMFFAEERVPVVRKMIMAQDDDERHKALDKLLPMQRDDFYGLFKVMKDKPVTIRLLDPPLHEFLPNKEELRVDIAVLKEKGKKTDELKGKEEMLSRVEQLHEFNPMLGTRGCRLGIVQPEITKMQVRAIFEAACKAKKEGIDVFPEVMIPLVGHLNEFKHQKAIAEEVIKEVFKEQGTEVRHLIGTMIELPRACLVADEIAKEAEFFSFGTNDLTQTTFGYSRDDAEKFIRFYLDNKILEYNPFHAIDQIGVGELVKIGVEKGRKTNKDLEIGICGEHGGEASSVEFCHRINLDYVSCSPYRIPIARLAAAHAAVKEKMK